MNNIIFIYYGFLTILTQLVIFRELSALFYGSDLFLGTFLSSWLFWVGSGSLFVRRLMNKERSAAVYFSYGFLAIALMFPAMVLLIRASKGVFAFGEFIGPLGTMLYTFSVMSVFCFVIGGLFTIACVVVSDKIKSDSAMGRVYLYESLGAVIGGVAFTYILIGFVPTFIIALALSLGCVLVSLCLMIRKISAGGVLLIASALIILFVDLRIEPKINSIQWKRYQFIEQKEARNATLSLVNMGSIKNVFVDGMLSASFPNPESYEPAAHWPLLASARPERILIIGEASLGVLKEALKHGPKTVDYVVPDSSFIDIAKPYLDSEDISVLKDPIIHIHYSDARTFLRKDKNKYDVVIINIQEVPNLKTNRLYTKEFYARIMSTLKPEGILAVSVVSSENYLSSHTRTFNSSVYLTLKSVFNTVEVVSGDTAVFLASPSAIDMQKDTILGRFSGRGLSNLCFIPSYIEYKLEVKRRAEFKKLLEDTTGIGINKDFSPTTCYYYASFWLNKFASPLLYFAAIAIFIAIVFSIVKKKGLLRYLSERKEMILIFILGFVGILLELIFLLGYQIISGYVYWQMGILFASFMSGLFLGSLLGNRLKHNSRQSYFILLVILSLIMVALSMCAAWVLPHMVYLSTVNNILIFMTLLAMTGAVMGEAFVVAGFIVEGDEIMAKAGGLYAADLWGAALGAILSTNIIVPIFGILGSLKLAALIGLAGLAVFITLSRNKI